MHTMVSAFWSLVLLLVCSHHSVLASDTVTLAPQSNQTSSSGHSAQINLPGFGDVDLSSFSLSSLSVPRIPTLAMPNMSLPTLPKIFSEVPCVSLLSARSGICRKQDACLSASGLPDGPCALGLGVCCTRPFSCGQTIIGKDSVIANPNYPEPTEKPDACAITIMKSLTAVQIRLDFEVFDIAGPDANGICSEDVMEIIGGNAGHVVPRICGLNHGQHLYIPVDKTAPLSPVLIKFVLSNTSHYARSFKIRATQLTKDSPLVAPAGCSQLFTGTSGVVHSFNYETVKNVGIRRITGLAYGICFQKQDGFCAVRIVPSLTRGTRSVEQQKNKSQDEKKVVKVQNRRRSLAPAPHNYQPVYNNVHYRQPFVQRVVYPTRPQILYQRPVYRPVAAFRPAYAQPQYLVAPVAPAVYYKEYKKEEPKKEILKEVIEDKKEALDGLLAKKKLLIDELFSGAGLPVVPALPVLPEFKLPVLPTLPPITLPEVKLPVLPELTLPSLPSLPSLTDLLANKEDLIKDLLAKKEQVIEKVIEKKIEKVDPYKTQYPMKVAAPLIKAPAYGQDVYYQKPVVVEDKKQVIKDLIDGKKQLLDDILAQKQALVDQLLSSLSVPGLPPHPLLAKLTDLKQELLEKKVEKVEKPQPVYYNRPPVYGPAPMYRQPMPRPAYYSAPVAPVVNYYKPEPKKEIVKEIIGEKKELVKDLIDGKKQLLDDILAQKQALIDQLLSSLTVPGLPAHPLVAKLTELKQDLLEKKVEKKVPVYGQTYGQKNAYAPAFGPVDKKTEIIKSVLDHKSVVAPSSTSLPAEVVTGDATILRSEPFGIRVQDGGDLTSTSRGFAIAYTHQVCA